MRHADIWEPSAVVEARNDDVLDWMCSSEDKKGKQLLEVILGVESRGLGHFTFQSINYAKAYRYILCS